MSAPSLRPALLLLALPALSACSVAQAKCASGGFAQRIDRLELVSIEPVGADLPAEGLEGWPGAWPEELYLYTDSGQRGGLLTSEDGVRLTLVEVAP